MVHIKTHRTILDVSSFLAAALMLCSCGDSASPPATTRYWNVVMAGGSTATITFGTALSADREGLIAAGQSSAFSTLNYNLYIAGGNTVGGPPSNCRMHSLETGNTTVTPGSKTGTIQFVGNCMGEMVSNLQIILGNSTAAILDADNNYVVEAGRSVVGTIIAPGSTTGTNSTGNITY